jgi:hypothetical protein
MSAQGLELLGCLGGGCGQPTPSRPSDYPNSDQSQASGPREPHGYEEDHAQCDKDHARRDQ